MARNPESDDISPVQAGRIQPHHEILRSGSGVHAKKAGSSNRSQYQHQDISAEYAANVLNGLKSLGVKTTPGLDRLLTDRYGQVQLRGFPALHVVGQGLEVGGGGFTRECSLILPSRSHGEDDEGVQSYEKKWGSVLAGVGSQFEHSRRKNSG